jgi:hypothetical protein
VMRPYDPAEFGGEGGHIQKLAKRDV